VNSNNWSTFSSIGLGAQERSSKEKTWERADAGTQFPLFDNLRRAPHRLSVTQPLVYDGKVPFERECFMALRHLVIAATLAGFVSAVTPVTTTKIEAAETVKKKKKKTVQKKSQKPAVKKNYGAPRPGEPNAGWSDDCLWYYNAYGRLPWYCEPYGRSY
jgi:hypothetical protein